MPNVSYESDEDIGLSTSPIPSAALDDMRKQGQPVLFNKQPVDLMSGKIRPKVVYQSDEDIGLTAHDWKKGENWDQTLSDIFTDKTPSKAISPDYSADVGTSRRMPLEEDMTKPSFIRPGAGRRSQISAPPAAGDIGSIPAAVDLGISMISQMPHAGIFGAQFVRSMIDGTPKEYWGQIAKDVADNSMPEAFSTPFRRIMHSRGYGDVYDSSTVAKAMSQVGAAVGKGGSYSEEKFGLPKEVFDEFANTLMSFLGAKGVKTELSPWNAKRIAAAQAEKEMGQYNPSPADPQVWRRRSPAGPTMPEDLYRGPFGEVDRADFTTDSQGNTRDNDTAPPYSTRAQMKPKVTPDDIQRADKTPAEQEVQYRESMLGKGNQPAPETGNVFDDEGAYKSPNAARKAMQDRGTVDHDLLTVLAGGSVAAAAGGWAIGHEGDVDSFMKKDAPYIGAIFIPAFGADRIRAMEAKKAGASREAIWHNIGVIEGKDGVYKQELPDNDARLKPSWKDTIKNGLDVKLSDIMDHDKLYNAAPSTKDIKVEQETNPDYAGSYNPVTNTIKIDLDSREIDPLSIIMHEIQHRFQHQHGMATGGNARMFMSKDEAMAPRRIAADIESITRDLSKDVGRPTVIDFAAALDKMQRGDNLSTDEHTFVSDALEHPGFQQLYRKLDDYYQARDIHSKATAKYYTLAGEVEARATQSRTNMSEVERRNTPPWKTYDVPEDQWRMSFGSRAPSASAKGYRNADAWNKEQMKTMPIYKDYGNGMKWVQLTRPGEFAYESTNMRHSIRGHEPVKDIGSGNPHPDWTERSEYGISKEAQAKGSGDAEYGSAGNGWNGIKNGDVKIYSLRDSNGKPHATIDVTAKDAFDAFNENGQGPEFRDAAREYDESGYKIQKDGFNKYAQREFPALWDEYINHFKDPDNIAQIKGKDNGVVSPENVKYVQDFVRSGKWSDVRDLDHAELHNAKSYSIPLELKPKNRYLTKGELDDIDEAKIAKRTGQPLDEQTASRIKNMQWGGIDPKLAKGLILGTVGAGIGGLLADKDNRLIGAALGAAAGLSWPLARRVPAVRELIKGTEKSFESLVKIVNPEALGKTAEQAAAVLASHKVKALFEENRMRTQGEANRKLFDAMPQQQQTNFLKSLEFPNVRDKSPQMRTLRQYYRDWADRIEQENTKLGIKPDPLDFANAIFKDPDGALKYLSAKYGDNWADTKFLRENKINILSDLESAGFELKYTNPERVFVARQLASDIAKVKLDTFKELASYGLAERVVPGMRRDPGEHLWTAPDGKKYYVEGHINAILHNAFNSRGLWTEPSLVGMTFRGAMDVKNTLLPMKLASAYHMSHITMGMLVGSVITNTIKLAAAGKSEFGRATVNLGKSLLLWDAVASLKYTKSAWQPRSMRALRGDIPIRDWTEKDIREMTRAQEAGFSPEMSAEYKTQWSRRFMDGVNRANNSVGVGDKIAGGVKATLSAPFALLEKGFTKPIFENWIPGLKWDAFQHMADAAMEANPALASDTLARKVALHKLSKVIDDRFGEMNYQTNFMNKLTKDIGVVGLLSWGWQYGFGRSYLGAVPEAWRAFTSKEGPKGNEKYNIKQKIARGELDKTTFLMSYVASTMMYNGVLTYALTGEPPKELLDYFFARNGTTNSDGSPGRVGNPFYIREFFSIPYHMKKDGFFGGLWTTLKNKSNPEIALMKGILFNKDYFDRHISNDKDPILDQIKSRLMWTAKQQEPMFISAPRQAGKMNPKDVALSFAGFPPAPKYITSTQADPTKAKTTWNQEQEERKAESRAASVAKSQETRKKNDLIRNNPEYIENARKRRQLLDDAERRLGSQNGK